VTIRSRPLPPAQKELDFEIDLSQFDPDDEVLRKTTKDVPVPDVTYTDVDDYDYFWVPPGTLDEDDCFIAP
jgi:hypothetical protein